MQIEKDFKRQMKHLKHMGEYAYKGGGKKHGSFDKYWQVAMYEARPIRSLGGKFDRPKTTQMEGKNRLKQRSRSSTPLLKSV